MLIFPLKSFFMLLRIYADFEPSMYSGTGKSVCVMVGGGGGCVGGCVNQF
jgi:hypothetical protein